MHALPPSTDPHRKRAQRGLATRSEPGARGAKGASAPTPPDQIEEREGFEPSVPFGTHDFQSCSFGHSDTSPATQEPCDGSRTSRDEVGPSRARPTSTRSHPVGWDFGNPFGGRVFIQFSNRVGVGRALPGQPHRGRLQEPLGVPGYRGEGGSRTHVGLAPKPDFESGAFGHSATSPLSSGPWEGSAPPAMRSAGLSPSALDA